MNSFSISLSLLCLFTFNVFLFFSPIDDDLHEKAHKKKSSQWKIYLLKNFIFIRLTSKTLLSLVFLKAIQKMIFFLDFPCLVDLQSCMSSSRSELFLISSISLSLTHSQYSQINFICVIANVVASFIDTLPLTLALTLDS